MNLELSASRGVEDCCVLIVDDQQSSRLILTSLLEDLVECHTVSSAQEAYAFCAERLPDLILMDVMMPDIDGHQACQHLAKTPLTSQVPVIFVTASITDEQQEKCWAAGAVDFVEKPINATTLRNRVRSHLMYKLKTNLLEKLIYLDRLTGSYNRHYMEDHLPGLVRESERMQSAISLVLLDIDYFKQFNDEYGHLEGDSCLWKVAKSIQESLKRPMDRLIRIGGEEFLVILPHTEADGASEVCERIFLRLSQLRIAHKKSPHKVVTVSAGVTTLRPTSKDSIDSALLRADQGLYEAKGRGRNNFVVQDEDLA